MRLLNLDRASSWGTRPTSASYPTIAYAAAQVSSSRTLRHLRLRLFLNRHPLSAASPLFWYTFPAMKSTSLPLPVTLCPVSIGCGRRKVA